MRTGTKDELIVFLVAQDSERIFDLKEHKEGRTLNQNAYYWQLLTQIADKLRMSKPECHNRMLRTYGRPWLVSDKTVSIYREDTDETYDAMTADELLHFAPTDKTKTAKDGTVYRRWVLLQPTHVMDTEQMTILIDGAVQEAKQLGIETLTPDQLKEMEAHALQIEKSKRNGHTD